MSGQEEVRAPLNGLNGRIRWRLGLAFALGGALLGASLCFHGDVATRQVSMPFSPVTPLEVTIVVNGPPGDPGMVGFLATVHPRTDVLSLIPLSGSIKIHLPKGAPGHLTVPLWEGVSMASPAVVTRAIDEATGFRSSHYFFMPVAGLNQVIRAMIRDTRSWPKRQGVAYSLHTLGYPRGHDHPQQELAFIQKLMATVPEMTPLDASALIGVAFSSSSNLNQNELFVLGNYVRGDVIRLQSLRTLKHRAAVPRTAHG